MDREAPKFLACSLFILPNKYFHLHHANRTMNTLRREDVLLSIQSQIVLQTYLTLYRRQVSFFPDTTDLDRAKSSTLAMNVTFHTHIEREGGRSMDINQFFKILTIKSENIKLLRKLEGSYLTGESVLGQLHHFISSYQSKLDASVIFNQ
ncbi:hypothetical protein SADUNF_Sadunf16G0105100 [Salix dunnii]|uniref:Uncharacterized protein n=1 Tax=Salix dunnii TaxID=1413687 RepID=A0A835MGL0_9ROSI|nr:hypothetical protein SADUNF_Sadunf16G0105100 [Salix dunnii]